MFRIGVLIVVLAGFIGCAQQAKYAPKQQCQCINCPCDNCENDATKCLCDDTSDGGLVRNTGELPRESYVDEIALPEKFKATDFPRIVIDGVRLWHDPNMPGWEASGGGYRSEQFNCPVAWMDFGGDRSLSDGSDFRSEDESLYKEFANVAGDIMVRHREGVIQIMDGGTWRQVQPGDKLRQSAVAHLLFDVAPGDEGSAIRIGNSDVWAMRKGQDWIVCLAPTATNVSR